MASCLLRGPGSECAIETGDHQQMPVATGDPSQKSRFREGKDGLGDDQMIEDAHVNERQSLHETPRDGLVRLTRLCEPRGMVMKQDQGSGVMSQSGLHDLARIDRGIRDGAAKEILDGDETMPAVEVQSTEDLMIAST